MFSVQPRRRQVRDHIPLEQGLRPRLATVLKRCTSQRPYSIRTRIKTRQLPQSSLPFWSQRPYSIRTIRDHIPLEQGLRPTSAALRFS